jgi:hypothetical protein
VSRLKQLLRDQQTVAQQMEGAALVEVLHAAIVEADTSEFVAWFAELLLQLPDAQQLGAADVLQLLSAAVGRWGRFRVEPDMICSLPAAQQLSSGDVVQRLLAAIEAGDSEMVWALLHLPAGQQLSDGNVARVLRAAEQLHDETGDNYVLHMCLMLLH